MSTVLWVLASYLTGSLPTSLLAGKLAGKDLREFGSKNLGATNVYRVLGWKYAVPVGLVDVGKGVVPVLVYAPAVGTQPWIPLVLGIAAVVGHVFSIFVRFKGGKGVATAAGVVLGLAPLPLLIAAAIWIAVVWITGFVSLGSILGAVSFPVAVLVMNPEDQMLFTASLALAAFILITHRTNLKRLFTGTENRFGKKALK